MSGSPQQRLDAWFATPLGGKAVRWLEQVLPSLLHESVGFYAIQLGLLPFSPLSAARVRWRWVVAPQGAEVLARYEQLPFASNSVDALLAPFLWSLAGDPYAALREIDRVLVPEGRLYWVGFNPWSPLAWCQRLPALPTRSVPEVRDALRLLGFETRAGRFGLYTPWLRDPWAQRAEWAGDRWVPALGSLYVIEAIKRVAGVRLIEPEWRQQLNRRAARLAGATPVPTQPTNRKEIDGR
jgi:SAM-dependent methyltransferase